MAGEIRLTLHDGEGLTIAGEDVQHVYENLWRLAPKPGAVSLAAAIRGLMGRSNVTRAPLDLTANQSAALREAMAMLDENRER